MKSHSRRVKHFFKSLLFIVTIILVAYVFLRYILPISSSITGWVSSNSDLIRTTVAILGLTGLITALLRWLWLRRLPSTSEFPFDIIKASDYEKVAPLIFRASPESKLPPYKVPYHTLREGEDNVQARLLELLKEKHRLIVKGPKDSGKTREITQLATTLCREEGFDVLVFRQGGWLGRPRNWPDDLNGKKLLVVLDNLHDLCVSVMQTVNPMAEKIPFIKSPSFQDRLDDVLKYLEEGIGGVTLWVVATARSEPTQWARIDPTHEYWNGFIQFTVPRFITESWAETIQEYAEQIDVYCSVPASELAIKSDLMPGTLVSNVVRAWGRREPLNWSNFEPTSDGSYHQIYQEFISDFSSDRQRVSLLYDAAYVIKEMGLPSYEELILELALELHKTPVIKRIYTRLLFKRTLGKLLGQPRWWGRNEGMLNIRDGVLEGKDELPDSLLTFNNIIRNDFRASKHFFKEGIKVLRFAGDPELLGILYIELANAYKNNKYYRKAIDNYKKAIEAFEIIRNPFEKKFQTSFFSHDQLLACRELIELLLKGSGRESEALYWIERTRGQSDLFSRLYQAEFHKILIENHLDDSQSEKQSSPENNITEVWKKLKRFASGYKTFDREVSRYMEQIKLLASSDKKGITLVQYFTTENNVFVFGFRPNWQEPEVKRIDRSLAEIRQFVGQNFSSELWGSEFNLSLDIVEWQELYTSLVEPIVGWTEPGDIVCLIPHDVLHFMPLHALYIGEVALIERNPIYYSLSSTLLKYCLAKRKGSRNKALVFGDSLGDLAYSRYVAIFVSNAFNTRPYLDQDVRKSLFMDKVRQEKDELDILHFSGHGRFHTTQPLKSGILMASEEDKEVLPEYEPMLGYLTANRYLTAEEVFNLELNLDLVTLDSTGSAYGQLQPGDEFLSLTRAFLFAGAPTVVATLWAADDIPSSFIIERFYSNLLAGLSKVEALQQAQLAVKEMNVQSALDYSQIAIDRLKASGEEKALLTLTEHLAGLHYQAGNYVEAIQIYEALLEEVDLDAELDKYRTLDVALTRCKLLASGPQQTNYDRKIYSHPYHWAPFILVGDWQ
jgi:CHAT domain-containing protein